MKRILLSVGAMLVAVGCEAGWLKPNQGGVVIQSFTTAAPISGNNTGTIATNGNSFQIAADNAGLLFVGGPGAQFRGKNDGDVTVNAEGAFMLGVFAGLSMATNEGKGCLLLGNLTAGQKAIITSVASAGILLGAGTLSNSQAIVVGDGNVSHGPKSVTAGSFWATGSGFHGDGAGLTNLALEPLVLRVDGSAVSVTNQRYGVNLGGALVHMGLLGACYPSFGPEMESQNMGGPWIRTRFEAHGDRINVVTAYDPSLSVGPGFRDRLAYTSDIPSTLFDPVTAAALGAFGETVSNSYFRLGGGTITGAVVVSYADETTNTVFDLGNGGSGVYGTEIRMRCAGGADPYWSVVADGDGIGDAARQFGWSLVEGVYGAAVTFTHQYHRAKFRGTVEAPAVTASGTVTAGALGLGSVGSLSIAQGTQLVFVASGVTNVVDGDITRP